MNAHNTDSAARFALLEMGDAIPVTPEPAPVFVPRDEPATEAAPEFAPDPVRDPNTWSSAGVSEEGAARAKADEVAALEAGFSIAPPVYEIGSMVNQTGVDNFRASREEFDKMPTAVEACTRLADQIRDEQRVDVVCNVTDLRMDDDGCLTRGGGALPLTRRAMSGLATHITPGGGSYLRDCPVELRAHNVNHWCENGIREDARATTKLMNQWENKRANGYAHAPQPAPVMVAKRVTLRTRKNGTSGRRENFAIVGPRYSAHDIDKIAEQVMTSPAIPADARADIVYDGYRARIDVLFHTDIQPEKAVAGEIFKAGIMLKTADDGSGSIQIAAQVWRNLCLNLIIIDHAKDMVMRRSHRGNGIADAVELGIADAMKKVAHFADKWSEATLENVVEKYGAENIEDVFRGLVFNKVVHVANTSPKEMHERLMTAWYKEPGYDKTAIVNAVTRSAHEETWGKWTDVEDLETVGGQLLYQPLWNVEIPDKARAALVY